VLPPASGHWFEPGAAHSPIEIRPAAQAMMISIGFTFRFHAVSADAGKAGVALLQNQLPSVPDACENSS
jgi:hypothetical protein